MLCNPTTGVPKGPGDDVKGTLHGVAKASEPIKPEDALGEDGDEQRLEPVSHPRSS